MGPYCKFCDSRCFVDIPAGAPLSVRRAYGTAGQMATCRSGQIFELQRVRFCYSQVLEIIELDRAIGLPAKVVPESKWMQEEREDGNGIC